MLLEIVPTLQMGGHNLFFCAWVLPMLRKNIKFMTPNLFTTPRSQAWHNTPGVLREYNLMLINIRKGFIIAILSVRAMALTLFLHWHFVLYFMQKNAKITAVENMEHFCGVINL